MNLRINDHAVTSLGCCCLPKSTFFLYGISILTVLISASMSRTMSHVKIIKHATAQNHEDLQRAALIPLITPRIQAEQVPGQVYVPRSYQVEMFGEGHELFVTDTVGLVDVNTADIALIRALLEPHVEVAVLERVIAELDLRRKQRRRFASVDVFLGSVELPREAAATLRPVLTTRSGLRWPIEQAISEEVRKVVPPRKGEWTPPIVGQGWAVATANQRRIRAFFICVI
ncbi:MAG: hypothetical protein AAGD13_01130 [Pseudomonadota bacterium]